MRDVALAVVPVGVALLLGALATFPNLVPWYAGLAKPSFNPPDWVFGPTWTTLYALMALACWRVLRLRRETPGRQTALRLYGSQLALNALWSWLFFAAHWPLGGLIDIVPQWGLVVATTYWFGRLDRLAAACLVPLIAWVGFAGLLNFAIWRLNG